MLGAFLTLLTILLRPARARGAPAEAAAPGALLACYQPLFESATGAVAGAEALVRRIRPEAGVARETTAGAGALEAALQQARGWHARFCLPLYVAAAGPDRALLDAFDRARAAAVGPPFELCIEVPDEVAMRAPADAATFARECRRRLVRFGVGGFGASPLDVRALERIAPDFVKLDRQLVETAGADAAGRGAAAAAIAVARTLGVDVAADGVSHPAQMPWLVEHGVRLLQGGYLAPPMTAPDFAGWLAARGVPPGVPAAARSADSTELRAEA